MAAKGVGHVSEVLLTTIIPTAGRPQWVARAVRSALASSPGRSCEVIVVPNGADDSWRASLAEFAGEARVRIVPVAQAHANVARNRGLAEARGRVVRFLDDDDYLYPAAAARQLETLLAGGHEACSGGVELVDEHDVRYGALLPVSPGDWPASALGPRRLPIPLTHLFSVDVARAVEWDVQRPYFQDVDWLLRLVQRFPRLDWIGFAQPVGAWFQHRGTRTSPSGTTQAGQALLAGWLFDTTRVLQAAGELDAARRFAAAQGLWQCVHRAFPFHPADWSRVARRARALDPAARPEFRLLGFDLGRIPWPLAMEWTMLLPRMISHGLRRLRRAAGGRSWRRTGR